MIWILIRKEIQEAVVDFRFWIVTILCMLLIPLSLYVSLKDYEQRLQSYQTSNQQYLSHSRGRIDAEFQAEGYRPPSLLSVFALGLKDLLNLKVTTTRSGNVRIESQPDSTNLQAVLLGRIDFVYIVTTVLSVLAFIFTFSSITGEKEMGTLRLMLSNATPRSSIILAKIIGSYLVFLVPFTLSILMGLLLLNTSRFFSLGSMQVLPAVLVMLMIALLFVFCICCLGVLISVLTHRSLVSMIVALLIWVVWGLVIPKISPMIAQITYLVESQQVVDARKQMARENLMNELRVKEAELLKSKMAEMGIKENDNAQRDPKKLMESAKKAAEAFKQEKIPLEREYEQRAEEAVRLIENEYANKRQIQTAIAVNLSRLSPICSLTYALSEIAGTGTSEMDSFVGKAKQFQEHVQQVIYDNFETIDLVLGAGQRMSSTRPKEGFDPDRIPVPQLPAYRHTTLSEALQTCWVDILLLAFFSILFFTIAFVVFGKYDVR